MKGAPPYPLNGGIYKMVFFPNPKSRATWAIGLFCSLTHRRISNLNS